MAKAAFLDREALKPMSPAMSADYTNMAKSWRALGSKSSTILEIKPLLLKRCQIQEMTFISDKQSRSGCFDSHSNVRGLIAGGWAHLGD